LLEDAASAKDKYINIFKYIRKVRKKFAEKNLPFDQKQFGVALEI
jgi:hypothetical protein